jgi:uncharacterized cupin superfamily protein
VRRFNVLAPEFDHASERDGHRWQGARVAPAVGAQQIGACLYELGDGERGQPFHFHHGIEEWLIVVSGSPRVRTGDGERVLAKGDILCFPAGPAGGHEVTGPGTVLIVGEQRDLDVVECPDAGTIELRPPGATFRRSDAVEGEGSR